MTDHDHTTRDDPGVAALVAAARAAERRYEAVIAETDSSDNTARARRTYASIDAEAALDALADAGRPDLRYGLRAEADAHDDLNHALRHSTSEGFIGECRADLDAAVAATDSAAVAPRDRARWPTDFHTTVEDDAWLTTIREEQDESDGGHDGTGGQPAVVGRDAAALVAAARDAELRYEAVRAWGPEPTLAWGPNAGFTDDAAQLARWGEVDAAFEATMDARVGLAAAGRPDLIYHLHEEGRARDDLYQVLLNGRDNPAEISAAFTLVRSAADTVDAVAAEHSPILAGRWADGDADDPADVVTSWTYLDEVQRTFGPTRRPDPEDAWLAEEAAAARNPYIDDDAWLADTDPHRGIHDEHELHDPTDQPDADSRDDAPVDRRDREPVEVDLADLRDTSTIDVTEKTDPAGRRRVPTLDETAVAVARAQVTLAEITARHHADAQRAEQDAAERTAADAARREELTRWSETDTTGADHGAGTTDTTDTLSDEEPGR